MKTLLILLILPGSVNAAQFYNALENKWETVPNYGNSIVQFNAMTGQWGYAPQGAVNQYNPMENTWQMTGPDTQLQYNAVENDWSYRHSNSVPEYNAFENKFVYPNE